MNEELSLTASTFSKLARLFGKPATQIRTPKIKWRLNDLHRWYFTTLKPNCDVMGISLIGKDGIGAKIDEKTFYDGSPEIAATTTKVFTAGNVFSTAEDVQRWLSNIAIQCYTADTREYSRYYFPNEQVAVIDDNQIVIRWNLPAYRPGERASVETGAGNGVIKTANEQFKEDIATGDINGGTGGGEETVKTD